MTSYMRFFKTQKQEEQNPDGSFFSYPEFCIDTNPKHKAAMTVQEVYILEQDTRIAALESQNKKLMKLAEHLNTVAHSGVDYVAAANYAERERTAHQEISKAYDAILSEVAQ